MKKILLHAWLFLYAISHGVNAETLEEQANRIELANKEIELSKENDRKKIPNIFDNYKNSLQITTGQPKVIDSDGNKVKISMDVFVKLNDPDLSLQIGPYSAIGLFSILKILRYQRRIKNFGNHFELKKETKPIG